MTNTILITGGAASGKSRWAVTHLAEYDDVLFLDTHPQVSANTQNRINYSCSLNSVSWDVKTGITANVPSFVGGHSFVIFDSLDDYTEHAMKSVCPNISQMTDTLRRKIWRNVLTDVEQLQTNIRKVGGCIVITTLDTGLSAAPSDPYQRELRGILGSINQRVANISDEVYFSVSGIQYRIR